MAASATLTMALTPRGAVAQPAVGGAPRPLSLAEALKLATGESEQIAIARAGSLRAQGQLGQARSALLPQLSTTMNWQKQLQNQFAAISRSSNSGSTGGGSDTTSAADNPITRIFASQYNFNVGLSASQPLFTGGRATANIRAAKATRESAEIGITSAQAQVQLDVTQSYYDALLTDRLVAISESSLVQSERTLRQVQLTRNVGSASEFELIRARVTRDNQRPGWLQSRTNRDLAYVRLRQLLNLPPDQPLALTDSIAESPLSAPVAAQPPITTVNVSVTEVLTIDPQVQAAVARTLAGSDTGISTRAPVKQAIKGVEVAQQQLKATKAQRLPSISATTNYQRLAYPVGILPKSLGDFFPNWTVGIGLSYPFFTGGRVRGEVQAAEATVIEARQRLRLAQEGASLDARQAVAQLTEYEAAWQASVGTAEQAQRAYDIAEVRFREGISTQLELSETRNQLQQALANRAQAARNLQVARKRLELLPYLPLSQGSTPSTGPTR
ncbi:TolC family protein [Gemmatimonas groenlandica]|uniref:TolC family protein n=1 Tax=Gemmatimonas groenlandica TaxID=2732249 RepID=A0A6M4IZA9_9BACT|nr:TolC family protein [Gemmatimonas groenlandica]QJR37561.1 TolC family protein [Gemmatimonas groenlandica]